MEGYSTETPASSEKKDDDKAEKKKDKAVGLGGRTFEFANKKDTAEKIADTSSIWEKLIPKDGSDKAEKPEASLPGVAEKVAAEGKIETSNDHEAEEVIDPSVETLSEGEKAEVVKDYAQNKVAELESGRDDAEAPEEAAAREANIEFLKTVEHEAEATPLEPVEEAASEQAVAAEIVAETTPEVENPEQAEMVSAEQDETPAEFEHDQAIELNVSEQTVEAPEAAEDDPAQQVVTAATVPLPPLQVPNAPGGAGVNGNQPPTPPGGPGGPGAPSGPNGPRSAGTGPNFNALPTSGVNPNVAPTSTRVEYVRDRRSEGAYFLAGGILGYLLGRRRGRIKTEKRMNAVSKKLEKQIEQVRQEVVRQEAVVREQARERYNLTYAQSREGAPMPRGAETTAARTVETTRRAETVTELTRADIMTNQRQAAERLGITPVEASATAERIQRFDHREVLAIAEKVVIDGTSLRTIYESKQITEPGLRRITREFLRGGDVKAALQAEIQVKEMQYERDPQMRDRLAASYAGVDAAQPQAASDAMATLLAQNDQPAPYQMHANVKQAEEDAVKAKERGKQALVAAWAVLVVVLVITAVILAAR